MISLLAFAFLAAGSASPSPGSEWQRYFEKVTRAGESVDADEFTEVDFGKPPIDSPVQLPFRDGNTNAFRPDTDAFYVYKDGKLLLNFSPSSDTLYGRSNGFVIGSWITPNGSYVGRNSFGVSAKVSKAFLRTVGVETGRLPLGEISYYGSKYAEKRYGTNYWIELSLGGADARTISGQAYVELALKANKLTYQTPGCRTLLDEATLDHPVEATKTVCAFPADVVSIAIKRRDTGATLAQWPRLGDGAELKPLGFEADWIGERDYPNSSKSKGEAGSVNVEMIVGPDGNPSSCRVTKGTGYDRLDRRTCEILNQKAKFEPFVESGASEKVYTRVVNWPSGTSGPLATILPPSRQPGTEP